MKKVLLILIIIVLSGCSLKNNELENKYDEQNNNFEKDNENIINTQVKDIENGEFNKEFNPRKSDQLILLFSENKDELISILGDNYIITESGPEAEYDGYYYEQYGLNAVFNQTDYVEYFECKEIDGVSVRMLLSDVMKILGETKIEEVHFPGEAGVPETHEYQLNYNIEGHVLRFISLDNETVDVILVYNKDYSNYYFDKKANKFNLYKLQRKETNLYSYNNITFKKTENALLYNKNSGDDFEVICNFQKEVHNNDNDKYTKYEEYKEVLWDYKNNKVYGTSDLPEMPFIYFPYKPAFICRYEDYDYFELTIMHGGGSGEFWGGENSGIYVGVNHKTMETKDFGDFRAGYCKEKDNWVYYLDLINVDQERAKDFPEIPYIIGIGYLYRMRPDGRDKELLTDKVVAGMFYFHDSKIYYKSHEDEKLHVISENGQKEFKYKNDLDLSDIYYHNIEFYGNFGIIEDWCASNFDICFTDNFDGVKKIDVEHGSTEVIGWDENSLVYSAHSTFDLEDDILYLFTNIKFD